MVEKTVYLWIVASGYNMMLYGDVVSWCYIICFKDLLYNLFQGCSRSVYIKLTI
jgi:hypothetical protein